jgi:hypothetical protein
MALAEPQARVDAAVGPPLEALVEKYRGRRFEELLRDPGFTRLSPVGVQALAAKYRRQTKRLGRIFEEARTVEALSRRLLGRRLPSPRTTAACSRGGSDRC